MPRVRLIVALQSAAIVAPTVPHALQKRAYKIVCNGNISSEIFDPD
jgi:hypothetical protein